MFRKNYFYILLFVLFVTTPAVSNAADNTLKVAVVDIRKIDSDSLGSQDAKKKISDKEITVHKLLMERKKAVETGFRSLESQRSILSSSELEQKAQKLENEYQKLQTDGNFYAEVFALTRSYIFDLIKDNVGVAAKAVANSKKNNYSLVMLQESVVYFNNNEVVDITNDVINKMNSTFKKINFEQIYEKAKKDVSKKLTNR